MTEKNRAHAKFCRRFPQVQNPVFIDHFRLKMFVWKGRLRRPIGILRADIRRARLCGGPFSYAHDGHQCAKAETPCALVVSMDDTLDFEKQGGLITAVVQDAKTDRVLMVGYMNREAFERTIETGHVTFFSRSRQKLWTKGESSGHYLNLKSISTDCDGDALLVKAEPIGPGVCHNGFYSCFYRRFEDGTWVERDERAYDPGAIYGAKA